jgi:membrane associated rhomboid family serine protease
MLEDRDYMRQPEFGDYRWHSKFRLNWTWTNLLVASYVLVFLAQLIVGGVFHQQEFFYKYLALSREGIAQGFVWQLVTYQFMHGGWMHLILNCWAILIFGSELERMLGVRRYLTLAFSSGIVGGVFQVLTAMLWPSLFGGSVVGASACAFGLVAAFALMFPDQELTILILFVIPVRLRARTLLMVSVVIALMGILFPLGKMFPLGNVANAAHLGGMAMGWFYVKKIIKNPALLGTAGEERLFRATPAPAAESPADDAADEDVDAVLDKISARGINSLTARERAILEAARKKMAQR